MAPEVNSSPLSNNQLLFLNRVTSIPLVTSALESAKTLYDTSKSKYQLIDQLEISVKTRVVPQFQPLVEGLHAYDAQLAQIDSFACSGLDLLEGTLPIIKEPTEKVIENSRRLMDERIILPVKTVATGVSSTITKSLEDGKQLITVASLAVDERLKNSPYVTEVFHFSATFADRILGPDSDVSVPSDVTPLTRAQILGQSVSSRIVKHASEHLGQLRSAVHLPANLPNLTQANELVKFTNERLDEQIKWLQNFINASQKSIAPAQTQLSATAHAISTAVLTTLTTVSTTVYTMLPESVRIESGKLQQLLTEQLENISKIRPSETEFYHRVVEAAQTGRTYLDIVREQLIKFYSANVAQYVPNGTVPTTATPVEVKQ